MLKTNLKLNNLHVIFTGLKLRNQRWTQPTILVLPTLSILQEASALRSAILRVGQQHFQTPRLCLNRSMLQLSKPFISKILEVMIK
jgi:hypothetical protein